MGKNQCWQAPHKMAWWAGLWFAGRLLHIPDLKHLTELQPSVKCNVPMGILRRLLSFGQAHNQVGIPGGAKSFLRGAQIF